MRVCVDAFIRMRALACVSACVGIRVRTCVCVRACGRVCVCARVCAWVRVCASARACECERVHVCETSYIPKLKYTLSHEYLRNWDRLHTKAAIFFYLAVQCVRNLSKLCYFAQRKCKAHTHF